jgi:hypothetical protein
MDGQLLGLIHVEWSPNGSISVCGGLVGKGKSGAFCCNRPCAVGNHRTLKARGVEAGRIYILATAGGNRAFASPSVSADRFSTATLAILLAERNTLEEFQRVFQVVEDSPVGAYDSSDSFDALMSGMISRVRFQPMTPRSRRSLRGGTNRRESQDKAIVNNHRQARPTPEAILKFEEAGVDDEVISVHDPAWWWAKASNLRGLGGPVVRFNLAHASPMKLTNLSLVGEEEESVPSFTKVLKSDSIARMPDSKEDVEPGQILGVVGKGWNDVIDVLHEVEGKHPSGIKPDALDDVVADLDDKIMSLKATLAGYPACERRISGL